MKVIQKIHPGQKKPLYVSIRECFEIAFSSSLRDKFPGYDRFDFEIKIVKNEVLFIKKIGAPWTFVRRNNGSLCIRNKWLFTNFLARYEVKFGRYEAIKDGDIVTIKFK